MPHREAELKAAFFRELKSRLPGYYVLQFSSRGAPDRAIFGGGCASLLEFKHATPFFASPGDQQLMMMRLATAVYCRYVIWREDAAGQQTIVVHPNHVHDKSLRPEVVTPGFNHVWLVQHIKQVHTSGCYDPHYTESDRRHTHV